MADICSTCALPVEICVCEDIAREQQEIRVRIEKRRYGKLMTVLEGLSNDIDITDFNFLASNFAERGFSL